jgi:hypothetical protein
VLSLNTVTVWAASNDGVEHSLAVSEILEEYRKTLDNENTVL